MYRAREMDVRRSENVVKESRGEDGVRGLQAQESPRRCSGGGSSGQAGSERGRESGAVATQIAMQVPLTLSWTLLLLHLVLWTLDTSRRGLGPGCPCLISPC